MKRIKRYHEAISGTELVAPIGPSFPREKNDKMGDNSIVIQSLLNNKVYTHDDYNDIYCEYLKKGGKPLHGFNENNLDIIISFLNQHQMGFL